MNAILRNIAKTFVLSPYTIENIAGWKYSNIDIRHKDVVKSSLLLVPEEGVRHPHFPGIRHCQVFNTA